MYTLACNETILYTRVDPGFQVKERTLKKSLRAEGRTKIFGEFCGKNHDFTQIFFYFFQFWGGGCMLCAHPPNPICFCFTSADKC